MGVTNHCIRLSNFHTRRNPLKKKSVYETNINLSEDIKSFLKDSKLRLSRHFLLDPFRNPPQPHSISTVNPATEFSVI